MKNPLPLHPNGRLSRGCISSEITCLKRRIAPTFGCIFYRSIWKYRHPIWGSDVSFCLRRSNQSEISLKASYSSSVYKMFVTFKPWQVKKQSIWMSWVDTSLYPVFEKHNLNRQGMNKKAMRSWQATNLNKLRWYVAVRCF